MTKNKYYGIEEMVSMIEEPNASACRGFLQNEASILRIARGSKANHQAWEGGYLDHITEVMNVACIIYDSINDQRKLPFEKSDVLLSLFLHDLEKPWKYNKIAGRFVLKEEMNERAYIRKFVDEKVKLYGFKLTDEHRNAIEFAEGEIGVFSNDKRNMGALAAMVHMCDVWSARGWYEFPKKKGEW